MPRKFTLADYATTKEGTDLLHTLEPVTDLMPYNQKNGRRWLLELVDDYEDGGDPAIERFFNQFKDPPAPPDAVQVAAVQLRQRGLLKPSTRKKVAWVS